jgi:hypothetical protein
MLHDSWAPGTERARPSESSPASAPKAPPSPSHHLSIINLVWAFWPFGLLPFTHFVLPIYHLALSFHLTLICRKRPDDLGLRRPRRQPSLDELAILSSLTRLQSLSSTAEILNKPGHLLKRIKINLMRFTIFRIEQLCHGPSPKGGSPGTPVCRSGKER